MQPVPATAGRKRPHPETQLGDGNGGQIQRPPDMGAVQERCKRRRAPLVRLSGVAVNVVTGGMTSLGVLRARALDGLWSCTQ